MEQRYLPSTPQQRLQDLMKEHKITQAVLAKKIGVTESTLSRFINGTKDTLSLDQMISIARIFNVSTDFLLCMTDVPDRKNYDISELGLSAEAARNLYTGRTNPQVVSRLLENRRFAQLTNMIALYFDDTLASGFAVQNQIVQTLSSMLLGTGKEQPDARKAAQQAAQTALLNKVPVYPKSVYGCFAGDQKRNRHGNRGAADQRNGGTDVFGNDERAGCTASICFAGTVCGSDYCQCLRDGACRCRFSGGSAAGTASHGTADGGTGS